MSTDISDRLPEIAMTAYKPEVVITQERNEIAAKYKRIESQWLVSSSESGMTENVGVAVGISLTSEL